MPIILGLARLECVSMNTIFVTKKKKQGCVKVLFHSDWLQVPLNNILVSIFLAFGHSGSHWIDTLSLFFSWTSLYYTDLDDFDNTSKSAIFNASGLSTHTEVVVNISIVDDDIGEPEKEVFIIHLELQDAVSRELVVIEQDISHCFILDSGQGNRKSLYSRTCL